MSPVAIRPSNPFQFLTQQEKPMAAYVYIMSNALNTVVYTGVTNDLLRRVYEHKTSFDPDSFTARYSVHNLVYYEIHSTMPLAIAREKQIKSRSRRYKNELVNSMNPGWKDLYPELVKNT